MIVLGFTTGEWIAIAAIVVPLLSGLIVLALRGEILSKVNKKIEPVQEKVNELEMDMISFKESSKTIIESHKTIIELIKNIPEDIDKKIETREKLYDKDIDFLKQRLDSKQDK